MDTSTDADAGTPSAPSDHPRRLCGQLWLHGRALAPIYVPTDDDHDHYTQRYLPPMQQAEPLWFLLKSWLDYHFIQIRWDIERNIARLRHQRWGA